MEKWAKKNHVVTDYVLSIIHGRTIKDTLRLISPYFDSDNCVNEIKRLAITEMKQVKPIAGAIEFLSQLPKDRWAIVTSGPRDVAMQSIKSAGIPMPDFCITAEDITRGKPDPEPYLKAAEYFNVIPKECIIFEDAASGIKSGLSAGGQVVVVGNDYYEPELSSIRNYLGVSIEVEGDLIRLVR